MPLSVVAHRGNCLAEHENTLESVKSAIEAGIQFIEIDIQFTQDAIPIVFHDPDWLRMTGKNGLVANTHSKDLSDYKIRAPLKHASAKKVYVSVNVALLSDLIPLLIQHPNVTLFVEVKTEIFTHFSYPKCFSVIKNILQEVSKQVVVISFSACFLRYCKGEDYFNLGYVLPSWAHYSPQILATLSLQYIFCDLDIFPDDFNVPKNGISWVLYEVTPELNHFKYQKQGVSYLETYYPTQLLQKISSHI